MSTRLFFLNKETKDVFYFPFQPSPLFSDNVMALDKVYARLNNNSNGNRINIGGLQDRQD